MKLEIERTRFKNFLSFGSVAQEVAFAPGVNVVLGKDLATGRSNGAGKSSFLETIPFALFGTTHKDIKKDQLVNWRSRKHCEVILDFMKGEDQYSVLRAIKPNNFEVYKNDSLVDRPAHVKDYQLVLEDILGQRFNTFGSLLHSNINSSNRILNMKKPEKRKFIEDVFGLEIYSILNERARLKINGFDTKISDFSKEIEHNEINIENAKKRIAELNDKIRRLGSSDIKLRDAEIKLEELKEKHPDIDEKIDGTLQEVDRLNAEIKSKETITENIERRIRTLNRRAKECYDKILGLEITETIRQEFVDFCKEEGTSSEISHLIESKKSIRDTLEKQQSEKDKKLKKIEIEIAKIETSIQTEESRLSNLVEHKECPTCGQTIQGKGKKVLTKIKEKLASMKETHEKLVTLHNKAKAERDVIIHERLETVSIIVEAEKKKEHLYELKDKIKNDDNKEELDGKLDRYTKAIDKLNALTEKVFNEYKQLGNTFNIVSETKDNYINARNNIDNHSRIVDSLRTQIQFEEKAKKEFSAMVDTESGALFKLKEDNEILVKKQKTFTNIIDYLAAIRDICKDERVKQYAISSIMPYINQQVNHYLSEVGYGFYCVIDKWLESEIKGPGVTKATYGSLSGGEARGIDLAMQFALLDVARLQAGVWPDIVIMDEILDSSVDGKGIDKLMEIIKTKQREESSKIFIISHRDEIGDEFDADYTYFVEKDGYSTVSIL